MQSTNVHMIGRPTDAKREVEWASSPSFVRSELTIGEAVRARLAPYFNLITVLIILSFFGIPILGSLAEVDFLIIGIGIFAFVFLLIYLQYAIGRQWVRITVQEGATEDLVSFKGTLIRALRGSDGRTYHLVRLDKPVHWGRGTVGQDWILLDLIIAPVFKGALLERLYTGGLRKLRLLIGIGRLTAPLRRTEQTLDLAKVESFARGDVVRAQW